MPTIVNLFMLGKLALTTKNRVRNIFPLALSVLFLVRTLAQGVVALTYRKDHKSFLCLKE